MQCKHFKMALLVIMFHTLKHGLGGIGIVLKKWRSNSFKNAPSLIS